MGLCSAWLLVVAAAAVGAFVELWVVQKDLVALEMLQDPGVSVKLHAAAEWWPRALTVLVIDGEVTPSEKRLPHRLALAGDAVLRFESEAQLESGEANEIIITEDRVLVAAGVVFSSLADSDEHYEIHHKENPLLPLALELFCDRDRARPPMGAAAGVGALLGIPFGLDADYSCSKASFAAGVEALHETQLVGFVDNGGLPVLVYSAYFAVTFIFELLHHLLYIVVFSFFMRSMGRGTLSTREAIVASVYSSVPSLFVGNMLVLFFLDGEGGDSTFLVEMLVHLMAVRFMLSRVASRPPELLALSAVATSPTTASVQWRIREGRGPPQTLLSCCLWVEDLGGARPPTLMPVTTALENSVLLGGLVPGARYALKLQLRSLGSGLVAPTARSLVTFAVPPAPALDEAEARRAVELATWLGGYWQGACHMALGAEMRGVMGTVFGPQAPP